MTVVPAKKWRAEWLAALAFTFATVGLHFFLLIHAGAFCGDEVNVINLARGHSLSFMARDSFPVLLPLLIHAWTTLGMADTDLHLRLLGTLAGLGVTAALWLAVWPTARRPPLLSLVLFALSANVIFREDYLRAYGLGTALIVCTLAATCYLLENPVWWRTAILAVTAVLSVQTLFQNAVFFASIGMAGWMICWRRRDQKAAWQILIAGLAAIVSLLPYWSHLMQWPQATAAIRPGFSFVAAANNFNTLISFPFSQYAWVWEILGLVTVAMGMTAGFRTHTASRHPRGPMTPAELQIFTATMLVTASIGYIAFLHVAALITSPWYYLPLLALAAVGFDLALPVATLPRRYRAAAWGMLLATAGIAIVFATRDLNCRFSNVDLVVKRLTREITPQDYIVVTPWYLGISFDRYYRGAAAWDTLPPMTDHSTYRFDLAQAEEAPEASQPVLDHIAATLKSGHRVWFVGWMSVLPPGRRAGTPIGRLIAGHSQSFEPVDLKIKGATSDYENEVLLMASGWRTNQP